MTKHNDQIFLNRLNQHPQLRERIEALLSVIDNEAGDYTTAHDTENQLIEELRKMGNDALHCWADKACDKSSTHFHEQNPKYHYDGKKKSGGIQLSEKSR
jgi:hypothetical protein